MSPNTQGEKALNIREEQILRGIRDREGGSIPRAQNVANLLSEGYLCAYWLFEGELALRLTDKGRDCLRPPVNLNKPVFVDGHPALARRTESTSIQACWFDEFGNLNSGLWDSEGAKMLSTADHPTPALSNDQDRS